MTTYNISNISKSENENMFNYINGIKDIFELNVFL